MNPDGGISSPLPPQGRALSEGETMGSSTFAQTVTACMKRGCGILGVSLNFELLDGLHGDQIFIKRAVREARTALTYRQQVKNAGSFSSYSLDSLAPGNSPQWWDAPTCYLTNGILQGVTTHLENSLGCCPVWP